MKRAIVLFILGVGLIAGGIAAFAAVIYLNLPTVDALKGCLTTEMFKVWLCPKDAAYVPLNQISPYLRHAIIISEDGSFYSHDGFDMAEIKESFERNLEKGKFSRGGSTITQQLVKNVFLTQEKTISRKIKEAFLTKQVESKFTKDQIFERYLNVVQFGKNMYGVKAAANFYFHKDPASLNVLEASFLAMLLPNPVKYSSSYHQGKLTRFARGRIRTISTRLHSVSRITDEEYTTAMAQLDAFPWNQIVEAPVGSGGSVDPILEDSGTDPQEVEPISDDY